MSEDIIIGKIPKFLHTLTEEFWDGTMDDMETNPYNCESRGGNIIDTFYLVTLKFHNNIVKNDMNVGTEQYADMLCSQMDEFVADMEEYASTSESSMHDKEFIEQHYSNWFNGIYESHSLEIFMHMEVLRQNGLEPLPILKGIKNVRYKKIT